MKLFQYIMNRIVLRLYDFSLKYGFRKDFLICFYNKTTYKSDRLDKRSDRNGKYPKGNNQYKFSK